jgi:hypothetical protein
MKNEPYIEHIGRAILRRLNHSTTMIHIVKTNNGLFFYSGPELQLDLLGQEIRKVLNGEDSFVQRVQEWKPDVPTRKRTWRDSYEGVCPVCHADGSYLSFRGGTFYACQEHKVFWESPIGPDGPAEFWPFISNEPMAVYTEVNLCQIPVVICAQCGREAELSHDPWSHGWKKGDEHDFCPRCGPDFPEAGVTG